MRVYEHQNTWDSLEDYTSFTTHQSIIFVRSFVTSCNTITFEGHMTLAFHTWVLVGLYQSIMDKWLIRHIMTHICVMVVWIWVMALSSNIDQSFMQRDHFVYAPSQWETTLQCNVVSHWLGACKKWSLYALWQCYCCISVKNTFS